MNNDPEQLDSVAQTGERPGHSAAVRWFRQAMPYINAHRGKSFVIMLSGDAVADQNIYNVVHDIVLLNSLGVQIVIVHGIRNQLDAKLTEAGRQSRFVQNYRVTDKPTLDMAIQANSLVRARLETLLSMGLPNSPMHGARVRVASANVITAQPAGVIEGVDLLHTGLVRKIDAETVTNLLSNDNVLLLSPIGHSPAGEAFSIGYQHLATEIAVAIKAEKLIAFTDKEGLCSSQGNLLHELNTKTGREWLKFVETNTEIYRSAEAAIHAVERGIPRAHVMSYQHDGALLQELFSVDGVGTLIQENLFEEIRPANAGDVAAIIDIIRPLERQGILVRRDRDKIEKEIAHFTVIEREGLVIALAAMFPYPKYNTCELACITTHPDYRNGKRARILLADIERQARQMQLQSIFVLTTQTEHWFLENGFVTADLQALPDERQSLYNLQRNSKVLAKKLSSDANL